jgi:hypothetical protein
MRERLGRNTLFRSEACRALDDLRVDCSPDPALAPIERANQHAAFGAENTFGDPAPLAVISQAARILDPNAEGTLRVGHVRGSVLAAEVAVTGSGMIAAGLVRKLHVHRHIAAMTAAAHLVHYLHLRNRPAHVLILPQLLLFSHEGRQ